jgi:hypothetical protein
MASMQATAALGLSTITPVVIATRGERLSLTREHWLVGDQGSEAYSAEVLGIIEIDADERIVARLPFDPEDLDSAVGELDARYLAGEAAAYSQTWSVIVQTLAAFNRRELPAADWVTVDHRTLVTVDESDLLANIRASWDLMPDLKIWIEAVHRLSSPGAVVTYRAYGNSPEGFGAEWRMIQLLTVQDERINRCEIYDETDLDAALTRFDELTGKEQSK